MFRHKIGLMKPESGPRRTAHRFLKIDPVTRSARDDLQDAGQRALIEAHEAQADAPVLGAHDFAACAHALRSQIDPNFYFGADSGRRVAREPHPPQRQVAAVSTLDPLTIVQLRVGIQRHTAMGSSFREVSPIPV